MEILMHRKMITETGPSAFVAIKVDMAAGGIGPHVCVAVTSVSATDEASSVGVDCNCWGNE